MIKRIGFTVLAVLALSIAAQAADMESGTWVMNVAKSTHGQFNEPRSSTLVIRYEGGWRILRGTRLNPGGSTNNASIGKPDGQIRPSVCARKEGPNCYPALGSLTKIDDFHYKTVSNSITGKGKTTGTTVISPDGKTKTDTDEGLNNDGKAFKAMLVWDKQ